MTTDKKTSSRVKVKAGPRNPTRKRKTPVKTKKDEKYIPQTVHTFMFARNVYTVKLKDIKKITLLGHTFIEKKDDKEEIQSTLYIFSVTGNQIPGAFEEDKEGNQRPVYETIMEIKAEENEYATLYTMYEDLVIKWDKYQQLELNSMN